MATLKNPEAVLTIDSFLFEGDEISADNEITNVGGSISTSATNPDIDTTTQSSRVMRFTKGKGDPGNWSFTLYYNATDPKHLRLKRLGKQGRAGAGDQTWIYAKPVGIGKDPEVTPFRYAEDYLANLTTFTWAEYSTLYSAGNLDETKYNATITRVKGGTAVWAEDTGTPDDGSDETNTDGVIETDFNNILAGNDILSETDFGHISDSIRAGREFVNNMNTPSIANRGSRMLTDEQKQTNSNGIARLDYDKARNVWLGIVAVPYEIETAKGFVADFSEDNDVSGVVSVNVSIRITTQPVITPVEEANVAGSKLRAFLAEHDVRAEGALLSANVN